MTPGRRTKSRLALLVGSLLLAAGVTWLWLGSGSAGEPSAPASAPQPVDQLIPGLVASMDSPVFDYSPGWRVDAEGADPSEPADPWTQPAGTLAFAYRGRELALALAEGDYWAYLYVTVDGEPANGLTHVRGNVNSQGNPAGYKTTYAPELVPEANAETEPGVIWHPAHRAADNGPHQVRVEVWRGWGQTPLRGVAVDALPAPPPPRWPAAALMVAGFWLLAWGAWGTVRGQKHPAWLRSLGQRLALPPRLAAYAPVAAAAAAIVLGASVWLNLWWLGLAGLGLLALAALVRPALWIAALLFALPFYFSQTLPLLPSRAFSIIDVGVFGGAALLIGRGFVFGSHWPTRDDLRAPRKPAPHRTWTLLDWLLAAIVSWALISAFAADHLTVALHEWRAVFLSAGLFAILLVDALNNARRPAADARLLVSAWLVGATAVSLVALWQFASGSMLITAEGVRRVRAFYGSPNNLALYLERTVAVTAALALFVQGEKDGDREGRGEKIGEIGKIGWMPGRAIWGVLLLIQLGALLLTFSKGSIFLGLPAAFVTLWLGGYWLLGKRGESRRALWWLAGLAALAVLALTPFLGAERFRGLLDFSQGTGFMRLQLWRSSWRMALDHPLLGVGPDNFLYTYRNWYILPAAWREPNLNHPHNWLLDWWTRLGVTGLLLGASFFAAGIAGLWRSFTRSPRPVLALGLLAATTAGLAHGLIDVSYALPDLMIVWVLIFYLGVMREDVKT